MFTVERSQDVVAASFAQTPDDRLEVLLTALVRHLHALIKEVDLQQDELDAVIAFLTATGQTCTATRQEFVLLADVLGVSMLVDGLTNASADMATESTVLGPFHMTHSPTRDSGTSLGQSDDGEPAVVTVRVTDTDNNPLAGAVVDVWQADELGFYDVQVSDKVEPGNLRGLFTADADGTFWFSTVLPAPYPIPDDGPVGALLSATGRHPYRPAHIHFIAAAEGHRAVTTHIFVAGSPYLDSDAVFGVKEPLIRDFERVDDPALLATYRMPGPFRWCQLELVLLRADR